MPEAASTSTPLMRELGRDAIWFEYVDDPKAVTPEWVARFDAVIADGMLGTAADAKRAVKLDFAGDEKAWAARTSSRMRGRRS